LRGPTSKERGGEGTGDSRKGKGLKPPQSKFSGYVADSEEGPGQAGVPPSPLLAVPNVTAHPSMAVYQSSYCRIMVSCSAVLMWP